MGIQHTTGDFFSQIPILGRQVLEKMVDRLTRGTSLKLPDGETIVSKDGYIRNMFRTKFWNEEPKTYADVVFQPDPLPDKLLDRPLTEAELEALLE